MPHQPAILQRAMIFKHCGVGQCVAAYGTIVDHLHVLQHNERTKAPHVQLRIQTNSSERSHVPNCLLTPEVGIKLKRLVCFAARVAIHRQRRGMNTFLNRSRASLRPPGKRRRVDLNYAHRWDEVLSKFRMPRAPALRQNAGHVSQDTLNQQGTFTCLLTEKRAACSASCRFSESWICPPQRVTSTRADSLRPGVYTVQPDAFRLDKLDSVTEMTASVSSATLCFLSDKASGNLLMMKQWAVMWERDFLRFLVGKFALMLDTCLSHLHQRGKLQLKGIKKHIVRHFSIAHLDKIHTVQHHSQKLLELNVGARVARVPGPPDAASLDGCLLHDIVDVLFDWDAPHHDRLHGKKSQQHQDLEFLCKMMNAKIRPRSEWDHLCWSESLNQPCCNDRHETIEKTTLACNNVFFARSLPIPAESTWTHTVTNFKFTVLKRCAHGIGIDSTHIDQPDPVSEGNDANADSEGSDNYWKFLKSQRMKRRLEYYLAHETFRELSVYVIILDIYDSTLMYPMLGDPSTVKRSETCKIALLLDRSTSLIGTCGRKLLHCLMSWKVGGSRRKPWCVLVALACDVDDQSFKKWTRCQIVRLTSAFSRRYERRFATGYFKLWPLTSDAYSIEEKTHVGTWLIFADRRQLDTYCVAIRELFPTIEALLSDECKGKLLLDFESHPVTVDSIERLNSELNQSHVVRAPGRDAANAFRESVLNQLSVAHRSQNGLHPLKPEDVSVRCPMERVQFNPLIPCTVSIPNAVGQASLEDASSEVAAPPAIADANADAGASHSSLISQPAFDNPERDVFQVEPVVVERVRPSALDL
jgi:hypothetical protein